MANLQDLLEEDIFVLLGVNDIEPEKKDLLLQKISDAVQKRMLIRVADVLSEEEAQRFGEAANNNNQDEMKAILDKHNIDLNKLALDEAMRYRIELVELIDNASNK